MRQQLPVTISYGEKVYRPAGYRVPFPGEEYVAKDGHIKIATAHNKPPSKNWADQVQSMPVLIVREYSPEDFGNADSKKVVL